MSKAQSSREDQKEDDESSDEDKSSGENESSGKNGENEEDMEVFEAIRAAISLGNLRKLASKLRHQQRMAAVKIG